MGLRVHGRPQDRRRARPLAAREVRGPGALRHRDGAWHRLPAGPSGRRGELGPVSTAIRTGRPARRGPRPEGFPAVTLAVSVIVPAALVLIVLVLLRQAQPAIQKFGPSFLWKTAWNPVKLDFGALPVVY